MWGLDFDVLKWIVVTLGGIVAWVYRTWDQRVQRRTSETEAARTVKAYQETIAAKNAEIRQLRSERDRLLGAVLGSGPEREAHG